MDYILRGLTILIIIVLTNGILSILRKPVEASAQAVVLPKLLFWLGVIGAGFFVIPCIIILLTTESNWLILPFLAFSCLGASLIIAYCNCRIQYGETTFISKNFWGIKREYTYAEITAIRGKDRDVKVYLGKHRVRIDQLAVGKYEFLSFAKKHYRKMHNGN
ncbi:MAG: hypothetical protein LBM28_06410, partial [Oscillospiraceae bacterium]|nr:hypothetical protein [Oscillospiraceae bacterium]